MSNLPLKALKWDGDMLDTPLHTYQYLKDHDSKGKYMVKYAGKNRSLNEPARGFATIDDAKEWAWSHYNEKMQPYVEPSPTWIDVSKKLPEKHTTVLVVYHAHFDNEEVTELDVCTAFFDGETFDPKDQLFYMKRNTTVVRWMPIPEFSKQGE